MICRGKSVGSIPESPRPPAVEVPEEGEVPGQHIAGILGHDVLVDVAHGVTVVVRGVAEGFDVAPLPEGVAEFDRICQIVKSPWYNLLHPLSRGPNPPNKYIGSSVHEDPKVK